MSHPHSEQQSTSIRKSPIGTIANLPAQLHDALVGLRFGQIVLSVQDGQVIRIERTDRKRVFDRRPKHS